MTQHAPNSKKKKRRWPYDAAVTISLIALIVSAAQLLVTVPLFSQLLFSPRLVAHSKQLLADEDLSGGFIVENTGNAAATNVEIGVITSFSDSFMFFPNLAADIKEARPDEVLFKNRVVKLDRLLPGEHLTILVRKGAHSAEEVAAEKRVLHALNVASVPAVTFLRSAEGVGSVAH